MYDDKRFLTPKEILEKDFKIDASKVEELVPIDSEPLNEVDSVLVTLPNFKKENFISCR